MISRALTISIILTLAILLTGQPAQAARLKVVASIPYWDQDRAFTSFRQNVKKIDYLSLFWYTLDRQSKMVPYEDAKLDQGIIDYAHRNGVKVLALVANLPDESGTTWDWRRVDPLLKDKAQRAVFIAQALDILAAKKFDGLTLDFETMRDSQRVGFTAFVTELSRALHRKGKILRVAVSPRRTNSYTNGEDLAAIARQADMMAIMMYNEHWDESRPGPIASRTWIERVLAFTRSLGVPMNKVSMGVPLFAYDWPQRSDGTYDSAHGLHYVDVVALRQQYGVTPIWHEPSKSPYMIYTQNGRRHVVWYENHRSLPPKLAAATKFGVGGISFWRLGGEDPRMWSLLPARR